MQICSRVCFRVRAAVQRVRDYIRFADGKIPTKPIMATTLEDDLEVDRWTAPSIVELFRESQRLSESIHLTEIEVQNFDKLLQLLDECRRDNENYVKQLSVRVIRAAPQRLSLITRALFHDLSKR